MPSRAILLPGLILAGCAMPGGAGAATLAISNGDTATSTAPEGGGRIALVNTTSGVMRTIARGTAPAFSPDGRRVAFSTAKGLRVLTLATGRRVRLTLDGADHDPAFSPDGANVLFNRAPVFPEVTQPECPASMPGEAPQPCPMFAVDYMSPDDTHRVAAGGGPSQLVGSGCLPAPAPVGDALLTLGRSSFGVGCGNGPAQVSGQPHPGEPACAGRPPASGSSSPPRRAAWVGSKGGILLVEQGRLLLASNAGQAVCELMRVDDPAYIADAAVSPGGTTVAVLKRRGPRTAVVMVDVATARQRTAVSRLGLAATHVAWRRR